MFFENFSNHIYFNLRCGKQNGSTTPFRFGCLLEKALVATLPYSANQSIINVNDQITFKDTRWSSWQLFWLAKFYVLTILNFYLNMKKWRNIDEIYALHTHFLYLAYILAFIVDLAFLRILACGQVFSKTN